MIGFEFWIDIVFYRLSQIVFVMMCLMAVYVAAAPQFGGLGGFGNLAGYGGYGKSYSFQSFRIIKSASSL